MRGSKALNEQADAAARLRRLRAQGVLSEEEYQREIAGLRGDTGELRLTWANRWKAGRDSTRSFRHSMRWSFFGCVVVIALIGTYFFGKARSLAEARGEISGPAQVGGDAPIERASLFGSSSPWTVETTTDPMTDATVSQANATFEGNQFKFEVSASCASTSDITYAITSFDQDGEPAEMRSELSPSGSIWIHYQLRADRQKPVNEVASDPQYTNQILLRSSGVRPQQDWRSFDGDAAEPIARASVVTARLFMQSGEEVIRWPQDDPNFRKALKPCLDARGAERERLTSERAQFEQQQQARAGVERQERIRDNIRQGNSPDDNVYAM